MGILFPRPFHATGSSIDLTFDELPLVTNGRGAGALLVSVEATIKYGDDYENDWSVCSKSKIGCHGWNPKTRQQEMITIEAGDPLYNAVVSAIQNTQHDYVVNAIRESGDVPARSLIAAE